MNLLRKLRDFRFFNWWFGALTNSIPTSWRAAFSNPYHLISIYLNEGDSEIHSHHSGFLKNFTHKVVCAGCNLDDISSRLVEISKDDWFKPTVEIILPQKQCLIIEQSIPLKARNKARSVLELDLRRIGALEDSEIYSDFYLIENEPEQNLVTAKLVVAKRKVVDPLLNFLADNNYTFKGIAICDPGNKFLPVELLPPDQRGRFSIGVSGWLMRILTALIIGLVLLTIFSVGMRYWQLSTLNQRISQNLQQTMQLAKTITRQQNSQNAVFGLSDELRSKKSLSPSLIKIIEETSQLLPLDAYIQDFSLKNERLLLTGYANSAASLIRIFSVSDMFENVEFVSPVTLDPGSRKERFEIKIMIVKKS